MGGWVEAVQLVRRQDERRRKSACATARPAGISVASWPSGGVCREKRGGVCGAVLTRSSGTASGTKQAKTATAVRGRGRGWVQARRARRKSEGEDEYVLGCHASTVVCREEGCATLPTRQPTRQPGTCQPVMKGAPDRRRGRSASLTRGATVSRMVRPASSRRMEMKVRKPAACRRGRNKGGQGGSKAAKQGQHAAGTLQLCTEASASPIASASLPHYCMCKQHELLLLLLPPPPPSSPA